jgi:hypothetical protein
VAKRRNIDNIQSFQRLMLILGFYDTITYKCIKAVDGGRIEKKVRLSKFLGRDKAASVAAVIRNIKGFDGGRFFVNEFKVIFAPIKEASEWRYVYIGQLDPEDWFPEPPSGIA